ncbi:hypothetical protein FXW78_38305 [Rhodococcus opacus]|nr:hypothetical protein [Rhodococcus opacus]
MSWWKTTFGAAAVAAAGMVIVAPGVSAEPSPSPVTTGDVTDYFRTPLGAGAFDPNDNHALLLSPWGTAEPVTCSSFHGHTFGCLQTGSDGVVHPVGNLADAAPFLYPLQTHPVYVTRWWEKATG